MSEYYPVPYLPSAPQGSPPAPRDGTCTAVLKMATIGAVVGASAAAGTNIHRLQRREVTPGEALADTGRAAVTAAAASAVAGAVATAVTNEGLTRLGVLFAAATAVTYGIQHRFGDKA